MISFYVMTANRHPSKPSKHPGKPDPLTKVKALIAKYVFDEHPDRTVVITFHHPEPDLDARVRAASDSLVTGWHGHMVTFTADVSVLTRSGGIKAGRTRIIMEDFTGTGRVHSECEDPRGIIVNVQLAKKLGTSRLLVEWEHCKYIEITLKPGDEWIF